MKHRKHSIRWKMILLTFGAVFGTVGLCLLLNETFLVRYYENSKQERLGSAYQEINELIGDRTEAILNGNWEPEREEESDEEKEALLLELDILCERSDITVVIIKDILSNEQKPEAYVSYYFGNGNRSSQDKAMLRDLIGDYFYPGYGQEVKEKELREETADYNIYSLYDNRMKSKYIELVGMLDNGHIILIRSNVESMQESVKIANKFLIYAGAVSAVIVSLIMFFVGRRFTKPVLQLADIAKDMSELNFDVKYPVKSKDEIGELGRSINTLSEKLEKTVSELKSANNELQVDIERKTKADEMRKEFLSNVTHELKTPIALIQGYAEGLKDNINESPEDREFYCDVIIDEAAKMNQMVKKLLTLNQLEFGTTPVEFSRFNITELLQSVLDSTDILAKQKEVTVYFEQQAPVYVWADEYMIEEVVTNYISNALHHADGAKIIEVKVIPYADRVRVAVYNTGANIPEEELSKLWIKFYKVDKARTREYGGSGIGLSIVKAIMDAHNQKYGVKNHNAGVEFWFELDNRTES